MTRLLRVELRRYTSRRLVRLLAATLLGILATIVIVAFVQHNRDDAGARAKAERQAAQFGKGNEPAVQQCEADTKAQGIPAEEAHCRPTATDFFRDPRFRYAAEVTGFGNAAAGLAIALTLVAAVGFIGAEWSSGTFGSLLLWEPRRLRVLLGKLLVAAAAAAVVTLVAVALLMAGAWLLGATRGTLDGATATATRHAMTNGVRGAAAAGLLAAMFGGIAVIVRSTGGVLGLLALYTIGGENVLRALKPAWARWELGPNVAALVSGKVQLETGQGSNFVTDGQNAPPMFDLHANRAALYLVLLTAAVLLAAAVILRRRDVT